MPTKPRKKQKPAPALLRHLCKHFGADPAELPVLEYQVDGYDRPNLHLAVEALLAKPGRQAELLGVLAHEEYHGPSLARLCRAASARHFEQGPVEYADVELPRGQRLSCVKNGLYLIRDKKEPVALLVTKPPHSPRQTV